MHPAKKLFIGFTMGCLVRLVDYSFSATAWGGPFTVLMIPIVSALVSLFYVLAAALIGLLLRIPALGNRWERLGRGVLLLPIPPLLLLALSAPLGLRTIDSISNYSMLDPWADFFCYFAIVFPLANLPKTVPRIWDPV